jgi:Na+/H+-translocating membrane pyrophosphatase
MKLISGVSGLISFLTGIIISGIPISISFSNSGSAWDNSKKIIESN